MKHHLSLVGITPKTRTAYQKALRRLLAWIQKQTGTFPETFEALDELVSEYLNEMYQEGESITYGGYVLSALKRFIPRAKPQLLLSQSYFRNWKKDHVPVRASPLSWHVVRALASAAFCIKRFDLCLCLLLGFIFFLRTSEIMHLKVSDVKIFDTCTIAINLGLTKTSKHNEQSLHHRDERLSDIVKFCLHELVDQVYVFDQPVGLFRENFTSLCNFCFLQDCNFSPYSLRRGGATWYFLATGSFDLVIQRGRWLDVPTARVYISDSQANLIRLSLSAAANDCVGELNCKWLEHFKIIQAAKQEASH
jgi:integrase